MSNWQPGFASFNGKTWSLHPSSKNLSVKLNYRNHMGTGFTEYPNGVFWLATTKGVRRIEGNSWYDLTIEDGLPHDRAFSIIKGDQRGLWIGTEKGLVRYTPPPIHSQPPVVKIRRIDGEYVLDDRIYLTGLSFVTIAWGGGDLKTGDNRLVYQYSIDGQWSDSLKQNTATVGLMNGEHQFSVRAIDHHFNTSAVDSMTIIVKTEAPVLSITNLANGDIVSGEFYIKGRIEDDDFAAFQLFISDITRLTIKLGKLKSQL